MKKILICLVGVFILLKVNAQLKDNTGLPEKRFGLIEITAENRAEALEALSRIPKLSISPSLKTAKSGETAVTFVDNSDTKFFPPIVSQISNSCGPASNVHYIYTYELNLLHDRDGKLPENIANYMYIWNFMNGGIERGTYAWDVYATIEANGVVPESVYVTESTTEWASGFDVYKTGMSNRVGTLSRLDPTVPGDLELMKQYLIDHGNGSAHGGLIQFSAFADPLAATPYDEVTDTGLKAIIPEFGTSGMHSMAIVGFDDSVWWDYNKDGQKDDYEMGAFIVANSWGTSWGDQGKFYAPYHTFTTLEQGEGGTGNMGKECLMIAAEERDVKVAICLGLEHDSRNDVSVKVGIAADKDAKYATTSRYFKWMRNAGGDHYMRGKYGPSNKIIEVGIDVTDLLDEVEGTESPAFFVDINDKDAGAKSGDGEILYCTLVDYRTTPAKEYIGVVDAKTLEPGEFVKIKINTTPIAALNDNAGTDFMGFSTLVGKRCVSVVLNSKKESQITAELLDEVGSVVTIMFEDTTTVGTNVKIWEAKNIPVGKYTVRVVADNQIMCKTIELK
ncbi:hypothetical protein EO244_11620 [Ancylomarina salipaludis]|uniref:Peptidase C1A papain C-terminal domain-containing protein n=1 Tax=Ancylomarina salipaludis TaxID=2501299 RepID=A0A4Q1JL32_9BACT|nr:C1 family peptidase [Ancylomarina salipaludis]RXQ92191.1 hypothetical protein EO244_11620 [Ancylomarina salipaludis]